MTPQDIVIQIREKSGLSQYKFAELTGLHRSAINNFETGKRNPMPHHAKKYLKITNEFSLEDFYK